MSENCDLFPPGGALTLAPPSRRWVYKSNALIRSRYDWTTNVHRVVAVLISQLEYGQERFGHQRLYASELQAMTGSRSHSLYADMADLAEALVSLKVEVRQSQHSYSGYNVFSDVHYVEGEGHLRARFNPNMRDFLLELKQRYTRYQLEQVMQLSSPYAIRFYEICAMMEGIGWITLPVDELRRMFKLEDKYKRYRDLRRFVIDTAAGELAAHCDLHFTYTEERRGRRVTAIKLRIHRRREVGEGDASRPVARRPAGGGGEDERDAFEVWYDGLAAEEAAAFDERVEERVRAAHGDGVDAVMRLMYRGQMQRALWQEVHLQGDP